LAGRAKLVYVALTWICSDQKSESTFKTSVGLIANKASLSKRTVSDALIELEKVGVIAITRHFNQQTKTHDQHTYTLRSFRTTPSRKSSTTPPAKDRGDNLPTCLNNLLPTGEEIVKEKNKAPAKEDGLATPPSSGGALNQTNQPGFVRWTP